MSLKPYGCGYEGIAAVRPTKAKDSCINRLEQIDRKIEPVTWSPSRLVIGVDELDCSGERVWRQRLLIDLSGGTETVGRGGKGGAHGAIP